MTIGAQPIDEAGHVIYPGANFCARCGAPVPVPLVNGPVQASGSTQGVLQAWAAAPGGMAALVAIDGSCRLSSIAPDLKLRAVGQVPDAEKLVVPPLGTRRGVHLVYADAVWSWSGDELERWTSPEGTRITGAATTEYGQLWITVIDKIGGLTLLSPKRSGSGSHTSISIPGFGGGQGAFLTLAVRAAPVGQLEALIWGDQKAAVVVDRAVSMHRQQDDAGHLDALLFRRMAKGAPILAQGAWTAGGARLVPAEEADGRRFRAVRIVDGRLAVVGLGDPEQQVLAAALTSAGQLFCRTQDGVRVITGFDPLMSHPLAEAGAAESVSGACVVGDQVLFQETAAADPKKSRVLSATAREARPLPELHPDPSGADWLPPVHDQGALWEAAAGSGMSRIWRRPIQRAAPSEDSRLGNADAS